MSISCDEDPEKTIYINLVVDIEDYYSSKIIETLILQEKLRIYKKLVDKVDITETHLLELIKNVVDLDFLR